MLPRNTEDSRSPVSICKTDEQKNADIAGKELSKMLASKEGAVACEENLHKFTNRHHPHLGEAFGRRLASPFGIVPEELDRQLRLVGQGRVRRRIPIFVRCARMTTLQDYLQGLGCQQACGPTKGRASQSCSWTWRRYRSIEDSSFGGR